MCCVIENYYYFSTKTYIVGTQKNRLNEMVLLSTQNLCFNWWIRKYSQFYAHFFFVHLDLWYLYCSSSVYDLVFLWRETGVSKQEIVSKLLQTFDNNMADMYVHMEKRYLLDTCVTPGVYVSFTGPKVIKLFSCSTQLIGHKKLKFWKI